MRSCWSRIACSPWLRAEPDVVLDGDSIAQPGPRSWRDRYAVPAHRTGQTIEKAVPGTNTWCLCTRQRRSHSSIHRVLGMTDLAAVPHTGTSKRHREANEMAPHPGSAQSASVLRRRTPLHSPTALGAMAPVFLEADEKPLGDHQHLLVCSCAVTEQ